jgi:hypothetical protein
MKYARKTRSSAHPHHGRFTEQRCYDAARWCGRWPLTCCQHAASPLAQIDLRQTIIEFSARLHCTKNAGVSAVSLSLRGAKRLAEALGAVLMAIVSER